MAGNEAEHNKHEKDFLGKRIADTGWNSILLLNRGCGKFRWATGQADLSLGLLLSAMMASFAVLGLPSQETALFHIPLGIIIIFLTLFLIPTFLRLRLFAPLGVVLAADTPDAPYPPLVIVMVALTVISGVAEYDAGAGSISAVVIIVALGLALTYGYTRSGRRELVLLAVLSAALGMFSTWAMVEGSQRITFALSIMGFALLFTGARQLYRSFMKAMRGGITPERIAEFVSSEDASSRLVAASFMTNYLEPKFLPSIIAIAEDEEPHVRQTGRLALARIWGPSEADEMEWFRKNIEKLEAKGESTAETREMIVRAQRAAAQDLRTHREDVVVQMRGLAEDQETIDALRRSVASIDATPVTDHGIEPQRAYGFAHSAARLLVAAGGDKAYAALLHQVDSGGRRSAKLALEQMAEADGIAAVAHLAPYLNDERTWVATRAVDSMAEVMSKGIQRASSDMPVAAGLVEKSLENIFASGRNALRGVAVWLTSIYPLEEGIRHLSALTGDRSWFVRGESVCALSGLDAESALPYAIRALSDDHAYVRLSGLRSLAIIKPTGLAPILQRLSGDTSAAVALTAAQLFTTQTSGELGEQS